MSSELISACFLFGCQSASRPITQPLVSSNSVHRLNGNSRSHFLYCFVCMIKHSPTSLHRHERYLRFLITVLLIGINGWALLWAFLSWFKKDFFVFLLTIFQQVDWVNRRLHLTPCVFQIKFSRFYVICNIERNIATNASILPVPNYSIKLNSRCMSSS